MAGNGIDMFPVVGGIALEKSSNVMVLPWSGRELNIPAEGPVERLDKAKKARNGS